MSAKASAAGEAVQQQIDSLVSEEHLRELRSLQSNTEGTLQDTAAILHHFNETSSRQYPAFAATMAQSSQQVRDIQKDLMHVFYALRRMKQRLQKKYPLEYEQAEKELRQTEAPEGEG